MPPNTAPKGTASKRARPILLLPGFSPMAKRTLVQMPVIITAHGTLETTEEITAVESINAPIIPRALPLVFLSKV